MSTAESYGEISKTPEWLEVLENMRKKPHKLAHEIGAGAPCLICKDDCKGLNLHFWRKLCIECKCRKEDHEVEEEEDYAQFEILFGAKKVKNVTIKFNAQNKSFDWVPPNVSPELAVEYLQSIPQSKVPISNSEGARYRKQQLEKQLPLHDVDPNACHNLSEVEMQEFKKYLDNLKDNVIGQGKIMKYKTPEILKEKYFQHNKSMIAESEEYISVKPQLSESLGFQTLERNKKLDMEIKESHNMDPLKKNEIISSSKEDFSPKIRSMYISSPKPYATVIQTKKEGNDKQKQPTNKETNSLELRTPSSFTNKRIPTYDKQNNNVNVDLQMSTCNGNVEGFLNKESAFSKQPQDSTHFEARDVCTSDRNSNSFPAISKELESREIPLVQFDHLNVSSNEVPFVPVQETEKINVPRKCVEHPEGYSKEPTDSFPSPPITCQQCLEILYSEEIVVQTERSGSKAFWHAKCFVCDICKELLVDLMYFFHKGKVYCGRHYAETMKIPRCYACDELIFVKEYTIAEGKSYHVKHFCCFHCDQTLGGKQYIPKDNQPVCLDCYQVKYGKTCRTCCRQIAAGEQRVSWNDLNFHVHPECFRCFGCLNSLLGKKFVVKNSNIFCSKECVQKLINE